MANRHSRSYLVELTAKKYKRYMLYGLSVLVLGAVAAGLIVQCDTTDRGEGIAAGVGLVICGIGFAVWLIGAALAWWNHS